MERNASASRRIKQGIACLDLVLTGCRVARKRFDRPVLKEKGRSSISGPWEFQVGLKKFLCSIREHLPRIQMSLPFPSLQCRANFFLEKVRKHQQGAHCQPGECSSFIGGPANILYHAAIGYLLKCWP